MKHWLRYRSCGHSSRKYRQEVGVIIGISKAVPVLKSYIRGRVFDDDNA